MASIFNMKGTSSPSFQLGIKGPYLTKKDGVTNAIQLLPFSVSDNPELWMLNGKISFSSTGTDYITKDLYTGTSAISNRAKAIDIQLASDTSTTTYMLSLAKDLGDTKSVFATGLLSLKNGNLYVGANTTDNNLVLTQTTLQDNYVRKTGTVAETITGVKTFNEKPIFTSGFTANSLATIQKLYLGYNNEIWSADNGRLYLNYRTGTDGSVTTGFAQTHIANGKGVTLASFIGAETNQIQLNANTSLTGTFTETGNASITGTLDVSGNINMATKLVATQEWANSQFTTAVAAATNAADSTDANMKSIVVSKNGTDTSIVVPFAQHSADATKVGKKLIARYNNNEITDSGNNVVGQYDGSEQKIFNFMPLTIGDMDATNTITYRPMYYGDATQTAQTITITHVSKSETTKKLETAVTLWGKSFDGSANISGDLTAVGNIIPSVSGQSNLGSDSKSFGNLYISGKVQGNLVPSQNSEGTTNVYYLGASDYKWAGIYLNGSTTPITATSYPGKAATAGTADTANKTAGKLTLQYTQVGQSTATSLQFDGSTSPTFDLDQYVEGHIKNKLTPFQYKGAIAFTAAGAQYTPAASSKGEVYFVTIPSSVTGVCTVNGVEVDNGDMLVCNSDSGTAAGSSSYDASGNWDIVQSNLTDAVTNSNLQNSLKATLFNGTSLTDGDVAIIHKGSTYNYLGSESASDFVKTTGDYRLAGQISFTQGVNVGPSSQSALLFSNSLTGNSLGITAPVSLYSSQPFESAGVISATGSVYTGNVRGIDSSKAFSSLLLNGGATLSQTTSGQPTTNHYGVYVGSATNDNLVLSRGNFVIGEDSSDGQYSTMTYLGKTLNLSKKDHVHTFINTKTTAVSNLDSLAVNGNYQIYTIGANAGMANCPSTETNSLGYDVEVIQLPNSGILQRLTSADGTQYTRTRDSSVTWTSWVRSADASKYVLLSSDQTQAIKSGVDVGTTAANKNLSVYGDASVSGTATLPTIGSVQTIQNSATSKMAFDATSVTLLGSAGVKLKISDSATSLETATSDVYLLDKAFDFNSGKKLGVKNAAGTGYNYYYFPETSSDNATNNALVTYSQLKATDDKFANYYTSSQTDTKISDAITALSTAGTYVKTTTYNAFINNYNTRQTAIDASLGDKSNVGHQHYWLKASALLTTDTLDSMQLSTPVDGVDGTQNGTGWFYCANPGTVDNTKIPVASTAYALEVLKLDGSSKMVQRFTDQDGRMYVRTGSITSWNAWNAYATTADLNTKATKYVLKAGDTMTGTLNLQCETTVGTSHDLIKINNSQFITSSYNSTIKDLNFNRYGNFERLMFWGQQHYPYVGKVQSDGSTVEFGEAATRSYVETTAALYLPLTAGATKPMTGTLYLKADQTETSSGMNANGSDIKDIHALILKTSDSGIGNVGLISPRQDSSSGTVKYDSLSLYNGKAYVETGFSSLGTDRSDAGITRNSLVANNDDSAIIKSVKLTSSTASPAITSSDGSKVTLQMTTDTLQIQGLSDSLKFDHQMQFPAGTTKKTNLYKFPDVADMTIGNAADDLDKIYISNSNKSVGETEYQRASKAIHIDIGPFLSPYNIDTNLARCSKKDVAENFGVKKSFGAGITVGTNGTSNTTSDTASYDSAGCTMQYDSTEECLRFTFA